MRVVKIEWVDSRQPVSAWQFLSDIEAQEPHVCTSVGFLIRESATAKTLALSLAGSAKEMDQANGVMVIPTCSIKSMITLEEPRP